MQFYLMTVIFYVNLMCLPINQISVTTHLISHPSSWHTRRRAGTSCPRGWPPTCAARSCAAPRWAAGAGTACARPSSTASCARTARRRRLRTPADTLTH